MKIFYRFAVSISLMFHFGTICAQINDSIVADIAPEYDQVGRVHRYWLGDSYRKLYNTPVKMRVMHLNKEKGGLQVVKLGGGMQTQSLRLVDPDGREWVLRSIQKYPERSLPQNLRKTIAKDIVQDQISISHPFGAMTVPTFNQVLGIPHASPELVYVGDDPNLGEYRDIFKNRAYMFEPRMPFEDEKTDNTAKVICKVIEDNDTQIDQHLTLRARLLDIVLGDWDRHEDNWRWDPEKEKGKKIYTPVPRDRDKVYYKTSGVFPLLLSKQWLKAHLQPFSPHVSNVSHWNFNARHFDRFFLNYLNQKDWIAEIKHMQEVLTDSVIRIAMLQMPDTIVRLSADELETNIKSRRDELMETGISYYKALAKNVDIPLSGKNEFVDIDYNDDGSITVEVENKKKNGTKGRRLFKRKFDPSETKEIRLYGIAGEDVYKLHGHGTSPIRLRLIGGNGYDQYQATDAFANGKRVNIYDSKTPQSNVFSNMDRVGLRLSNDTAIHTYRYDDFVYDRKGVIANFNYGVDRGMIIGIGYIIENQGFRKSPYAYRHEFMASYLTGRESFMFDYRGHIKQLVGTHDLAMNISALGPKNQNNFFGYGNGTIYDKGDDKGLSYYRNRYDLIEGDFLLEWMPIERLKLFYGSSSTFYHSNADANTERFLHDFDQMSPEESVYGQKFFTGASVGVDYDSRDVITNTKSGVRFLSRLDWKAEVGGQGRSYTMLENTVNFYKSFFSDKLTLANRTGMQAVWGNPYFFQHAQLGGEMSLRGFNSRRFTGKTIAYNNIDARIKLFDFTSYLIPGTVGAIGFYDIGRAWMTSEKSNQWHHGYGGGLYVIPGDLLIIQATVGISKEAVLPYIRIGLSF